MNIEEVGNINLPEEFKLMYNRFEKKFGDDALYKFASYIGFDWVINKDKVKEYELVPFEAELPFSTGSNGEHMGWLNMCPELVDFNNPFICWAPMGGHVFYHGTDVLEVMQNSIKVIHGDDYEDVDLEFLTSIKVYPKEGNDTILVNYEEERLNKMPILLPPNYRYEIAIDGVGVIAGNEYFSETVKHESKELKIDEYLELSKSNMRVGYFGTALFYLKEAYWRNFYKVDYQEILKIILVMMEKAYKELGKEELAQQVKFELNK